MARGTPTAGDVIPPTVATSGDECLLAGSKHTGRGTEITHRHASVMASGAPPATRPGLRSVDAHGRTTPGGAMPAARPGPRSGGACGRTTADGERKRPGPRSGKRMRTPEPPPGLRTDLAVPAGTGNRSGREPRRAPAGGTAENVGVTWERVDAEDGGLRACPSVDRPATPRLGERGAGRPATGGTRTREVRAGQAAG